MKMQLIVGALASNYYDFLIEEEDENLDTARKCSNTHPISFFSCYNGQKNKHISQGDRLYNFDYKYGIIFTDRASR